MAIAKANEVPDNDAIANDWHYWRQRLVGQRTGARYPTRFAIKAAKDVICGASQFFAGAEGNTAAIVKDTIDYKARQPPHCIPC
jgi:hypothetical protein